MTHSDTVVWFSLALDYGLSFISLGKPGTQGADAQLITGGLTAVESLLGTEIGARQSEGFAVDHGTSLMERFPIKAEDGSGTIFAQFLLQTTKPGEPVDRSQVPIARKFISDLAKSIFKLKLWEDLQFSAQLISPLQLYDYIFPIYENVNSEFKLKPIHANAAEESITNILNESFTNFDYSEVLNKLTSIDVENIDSYLSENRKDLIKKFTREAVAKFIQEFPLIFLYTNPKFLKNDSEQFIIKHLEQNITLISENIIYDTIKDFFENSMHDIMEDFDIERIKESRNDLRLVIEKELKKSIIKKHPLLYISNPSLEIKGISFDTLVDKKVLDKVFIEYDLGEVIAKIAYQLVLEANKDDHLQANLVKGFFSYLGRRFPGGLPEQLWHIIIQLLKIYASEAKADLTKVNEKVEIPDIHWTTLKQKFDRFKPNPVVQFRGESGSQVLHFFDGVREAIGRSFDQFYNNFIWDIREETYGKYFALFNEEITSIFQSFLTVRHLINLLNTLVSSNKFSLLNPLHTHLNYDDYMKYLEEIEYKASRPDKLFTGFSEFADNKILKFLKYQSEESIKKESDLLKSVSTFIESGRNAINKFIENVKSSDIKQLAKTSFKSPKPPGLTAEFKHFNQKDIEKINKELERFQSEVVAPFQEQISSLVNEISASLSDSKALGKLEKKKDKFVETSLKSLDKFKVADFLSTLDKLIKESTSGLETEFENATKEYAKIIDKEGIKQLKLDVKEGKVVLDRQNLENIKNLYLKEENKKWKGDSFVRDNDFLYAFSSAYLFDSLDSNISKKAINLAIFDSKSSKLIQEVIERGRNERKNSTKVIDILGHLKAELIETGSEIFKLSNLIVNQIKKSVANEDFPLSIIEDQYEILTLPIGTFDKEFKVYLENNIKIHPKLHLKQNEKSQKIEVAIEIAQRPSVGERVEYLMDAIASQVYNNELFNMGSYIESLKLVSSALGENERRRIQELFAMLGQRLTT